MTFGEAVRYPAAGGHAVRRNVMGRFTAAIAAGFFLAALCCCRAHAQSEPMQFAIHAQATYVEQQTDGFHAPYSGPNSLSPHMRRETADVTLYLGARLWHRAELWLNPEVDQGFGLDDTLGLAGFSSGEAYKVGRNAPYLRLQRAFLRQTLNLLDLPGALGNF